MSAGFEVAYGSPTEGTLGFSWTGPLTVDDVEAPLHGTDRFANRFGTTASGDTTLEIAGGRTRLRLDLARGERHAAGGGRG